MSSSPVALPEFLQQVFACTPQVADSIHRRCVERSWRPRTAIVRQGDAAGETFLLSLGLAHALSYGVDGQRVLLQEFRPGDLFGAVTERSAAPSPVDVVAIEEARAAVFRALDFLALIETHSAVGLAVSRILMRQLQAATSRMVQRATLTSNGRVYAELLRRAGAGTSLEWPVLTKLAEEVNTTRETASRAVSALERRGVIRRDGERMVILARRRLEELVV